MGGRRGGPRAGDAGRLVLLRCAIQLKRPSRDRFGGVSFSLSLQLGGSAAFEDLSARTAAAPRRTGRTARGGGGLVASVPLCPVHHHRTGSTNFSWAIRWWWFLVAPKIVAVFC